MGLLTDQEIEDLRLLILGTREPQTSMERHFRAPALRKEMNGLLRQ